jgi:hypothetical protein
MFIDNHPFAGGMFANCCSENSIPGVLPFVHLAVYE